MVFIVSTLIAQLSELKDFQLTFVLSWEMHVLSPLEYERPYGSSYSTSVEYHLILFCPSKSSTLLYRSNRVLTDPYSVYSPGQLCSLDWLTYVVKGSPIRVYPSLLNFTGSAFTLSTMALTPGTTSTRWTDSHE